MSNSGQATEEPKESTDDAAENQKLDENPTEEENKHKFYSSSKCQEKRKEPPYHVKDEVRVLSSKMRCIVVIKNLPIISKEKTQKMKSFIVK